MATESPLKGLEVHEKLTEEQKFELYRTKLAIYLNHENMAIEGLQKVMFAVSTGAIVLSLAILNAIEHPVANSEMLWSAWLTLIVIIVLVLLRYIALQDHNRAEMAKLNNDIYRQRNRVPVTPLILNAWAQLILFFGLSFSLVVLFQFSLSNQPFKLDDWNAIHKKDSVIASERDALTRSLLRGFKGDSSRH
jgi:ABC-type Fe3+ transport system permease subunit